MNLIKSFFISNLIFIFLIFFYSEFFFKNKKFKIKDFRGINIVDFSCDRENKLCSFYIIDQKIENNLSPGTIMQQSPCPGSEIYKNQPIGFIVSKKNEIISKKVLFKEIGNFKNFKVNAFEYDNLKKRFLKENIIEYKGKEFSDVFIFLKKNTNCNDLKNELLKFKIKTKCFKDNLQIQNDHNLEVQSINNKNNFPIKQGSTLIIYH